MDSGLGLRQGGPFDPRLAREARREETEFMKRRGIYDYSKIEGCVKHTGNNLASLRWVDTNRGTDEEADVRCRLVARDVKIGKAEDCFYVSMPPLEANSILFAKIAAGGRRAPPPQPTARRSPPAPEA